MRLAVAGGRLSVGNAITFPCDEMYLRTWWPNEYTNETTAMLGSGNIFVVCVRVYAFEAGALVEHVGWRVVGAYSPMMGYAAAPDLKFSNENDDTSGSSFLQEHF